MTRTTQIKSPARKAAAMLAVAALGACGGNKDSAAANDAEALRSAAEQSTPQAREVLMNEADRIEQQNVQATPGAAGSPVQEAMQKAGNVQAQTAPPPLQAQPRRPGDPAPPPKALPPQ